MELHTFTVVDQLTGQLRFVKANTKSRVLAYVSKNRFKITKSTFEDRAANPDVAIECVDAVEVKQDETTEVVSSSETQQSMFE